MEFLGCPAIFHESALIEFFANGSVRDGMVVSTIRGIAVEISESVFAETFGLPTEGLTDLSEVPRNLVSDAQSFFSASEKKVSTSCLKKEIKMQYRLLSDILAKSLFVKAGSFDAGYAIQICVLLKNIPGLELGESKTFPTPRISNEKTVHRIVSVNENVGVEEVGEAPRAKKTPVKKTMSKKRQATSEAEVAPVIKKKRSTKGRPAVARRISLDKQVEDTTTDEEDSLGGTVGKLSHVPVQVAPILDDVDMIIRQVISESTDLSSNKKDHGDKLVDETDIGDDFGAWLDSSFPGLDSRVDEPVLASTNLEKATSSRQSAEVHMSFDDLLLQIPNDMLLPSITTVEVSMLRLGESSSFRDKGKAILLEFQNRISADLLCLSTQFADIVEFIRGDDAKKGEGGSSSRPPPVRVERRPLPTPQSPRDVAGSSSAVRIPTFPRTTGTLAERVEQARRHILESGQFISVEEAAERIRQADFQESDRLQREREMARREKRSSSSRRIRGF
ncbi:hypothetical protein F511_24681 [Dorcoceras hygrometricum]|uniref:Uncharacterized protein n=1 Tax=Dorcoceras hygrometricum TaxID=472368 RepID=A0A2Z7AZY4_9LAMI|nr:hypothetical protein F511_24681 [Dorcoceras hygrometricum]